MLKLKYKYFYIPKNIYVLIATYTDNWYINTVLS